MDNILRGALLERVSTEDQAKFGDSLEAQHEILVDYANKNNIKIVGVYRDEGFSARKAVLKRPAMLKLIEDVKAGKIDVIIFTKLDRFFRNVKEYYKIQEILERNRVTWKAVLEDYDTTTSDGRLKINLWLSIAENEADRTSDRIKVVFQSKIMRKEVIFPAHCAPFGYKVVTIDGVKRLVKDEETREIVEYFFKIALAVSIRSAATQTVNKFGIKRMYKNWGHMCHNELYKGTYQGIEDYCEPYLTKAQFDELQVKKNQRKAAQDRVYLFTGLINCPHCGKRMTARYVFNGRKEYYYYRCKHNEIKQCPIKDIPEAKTEQYVLENIKAELEKFIVEMEVKQPKVPKKNTDTSKLKEQLRRVNVSYQAGNLDDSEYLQLTKDIKLKIEKASAIEQTEKEVDIEALKEFLDSGFEQIYDSLTKEEKQRLWRSVISELIYDGTEYVGIKFKV